jgi:hypothetical protein
VSGLERALWLKERAPEDAAPFLRPAEGARATIAAVDVSSSGEGRVRFLAQRMRELRRTRGVLLPLVTSRASLDAGALRSAVEKILLEEPGAGEDPWSPEEIRAVFRETGFGRLVVTARDMRSAGQRGSDPSVRLDTAVLVKVLRGKAESLLGSGRGSMAVRLFTDDVRRFTRASLPEEGEGFILLLVKTLFSVVKVTGEYDGLLRGAREVSKSA